MVIVVVQSLFYSFQDVQIDGERRYADIFNGVSRKEEEEEEEDEEKKFRWNEEFFLNALCKGLWFLVCMIQG